MRRLSPLLATMVGCVPASRIVTVDRQVWQSAVVGAPDGAVATGPLAEKGGISVEVGTSGSAMLAADRTRQEGALGHLTVPVSGDLRVVGRAGRFVELGVGGQVLPGALAFPAAADLSQDDVDVGALVRGGPQLRMQFPLGDVFAFTGDFDLRVSPVRISRVAAVSITEQQAGWEGWEFSESGDLATETVTKMPVLPRFATGAAFNIGSHVHMQVEGVVQQAIRVDGYDRAVWQCTWDEWEAMQDPDAICPGPPMPASLQRELVAALSTGLGLRLGRTWLLGELWVNMPPDDSGDELSVAESTPVGASLSLRVPLFRKKDPPQPLAIPPASPPPPPPAGQGGEHAPPPI